MLSVSQICDKQFSTHFTSKECLILKPGFVIPEEWIVMRTPRIKDAYVINMNSESTNACLFSKASESDTSLWHRRLGHVNLKNLNQIAKGNHVVGLPLKQFSTIEKCIPCSKGKQHKLPLKPKTFNSVNSILQMLHMDLFGPVNILSIGGRSYCLVITDDFSRFTWVFFLAKIVKRFIILIENQTDKTVKVIRCDNDTEFKNWTLNAFCEEKGIARQYSAARTPQQNGVAERRNRTLIEAARTMLVDSKLPIFFWAEAVNTACYVQNRVLLNKFQQKTPFEIFFKHKPKVGHFRTFGCLCTLLHMEPGPKFNEKADECYFIRYSGDKTAYRVYNKKTMKVIESYNIDWQELNATDAGSGPSWAFDYYVCIF